MVQHDWRETVYRAADAPIDVALTVLEEEGWTPRFVSFDSKHQSYRVISSRPKKGWWWPSWIQPPQPQLPAHQQELPVQYDSRTTRSGLDLEESDPLSPVPRQEEPP